ncbi:hypothetical protein TIFTF001_003902 [Ficus carica]|uniref:Uncharacterized protein n=1 Tax=Ficus carica TaxID=3494 RepID=A0AA88DBM9_FICCA|nr:hypothetical protein TIFTF001_003902 [Ficus carica]
MRLRGSKPKAPYRVFVFVFGLGGSPKMEMEMEMEIGVRFSLVIGKLKDFFLIFYATAMQRERVFVQTGQSEESLCLFHPITSCHLDPRFFSPQLTR